MHPLKLASRAYVNFGGSGDTYDAFRDDDQRDADEAMRAALLALAEFNIPTGPGGSCISVPGFTRTYIGPTELRIFRAILRSIADDGKDNG